MLMTQVNPNKIPESLERYIGAYEEPFALVPFTLLGDVSLRLRDTKEPTHSRTWFVHCHFHETGRNTYLPLELPSRQTDTIII